MAYLSTCWSENAIELQNNLSKYSVVEKSIHLVIDQLIELSMHHDFELLHKEICSYK